jgi:hypothetical protein
VRSRTIVEKFYWLFKLWWRSRKFKKNLIKNIIKNILNFSRCAEKFVDIDTKIIPFFVKYPIVGQKQLDFQDFFPYG